jgi:hypothetical protein
MSDERILLDNLHGKVTALTALCTALLAAQPDSEILLELFKQDLKSLQPADAGDKSDHYFLGMKAIHDHLQSSVKKAQLDLLQLAHLKTGIAH